MTGKDEQQPSRLTARDRSKFGIRKAPFQETAQFAGLTLTTAILPEIQTARGTRQFTRCRNVRWVFKCTQEPARSGALLRGAMAWMQRSNEFDPSDTFVRFFGFRDEGTEPHVSVRAMILSVTQFGITAGALEKGWAASALRLSYADPRS